MNLQPVTGLGCMSVYETELPGVGKKFELDAGDGSRLVVVIHHSGRREVFSKTDPDADARKLFELDDETARRFGTILEGTYFQPVATVPMETMLGEGAVLDWVQVPEGSPFSNTSLRDLDLRQRTGATVLAVKRGEGTIPNPGPELVIEPGDVLVVLGGRDEVEALDALSRTGS